MGDPDDHSRHQPTETFQGGPSRPPLFQTVPARWRYHATAAVAGVAFMLGVALGGAALLWWQAPTPAAPTDGTDSRSGSFDEHDVELILLKAAPLRAHQGGPSPEISPLHVDSVFLLSGEVASTVLTIDSSDPSLDVRVPGLPVTVSPTTRHQLVDLEITVRDCEAATRWTPVDRPFYITWRDEHGKEHVDRAGHYDRSMATSLTRRIDAVCR